MADVRLCKTPKILQFFAFKEKYCNFLHSKRIELFEISYTHTQVQQFNF